MQRRPSSVARRSSARPRGSAQGSAWLVRVGLGALVVAALVVAQLASLGHLALVRHVQCEHGAWVHAPHGDAEAVNQAAPAEHGAAATTGSRETDHDHCDGLALRPALLAVDATCAAPELLPTTDTTFRVHSRPAAPVVAILDLAPKSSPPS